ncbi:hypothetical protein C2G38_2044174 [Gigaspora rosea]|uniref:Uncharacterized protein n=1 Tax=Gigaspora rosea TaxID=44941 RepID=A0A397UHE0_9GLOM|nr:hypothetical protein C2G38_2044174 [Gigaspora rosea]
MEKHSIQDMPEIQKEDMLDVDDDGDKNNHPTDKSTTPSGEESCKRPSKDTSENKTPSKKAKKEIDTAEDNLQRTIHDLIRCYYNFGQAIKQLFDHFKKTCNEDVSNARVNDRIRDQISVQDKLTETNLRKKKERGKKVFRLFSNVGGKEAIE